MKGMVYLKKGLLKRTTALLLVLGMVMAPSALAENTQFVDIMPINNPVDMPDATVTALLESLALLEVYYAEADLESWMDILAAYALDVLPENADQPEEESPAAQILCGLALGKDPFTLPGDPASTLAASQKADGSFGESISEHVYAMLALSHAYVRTYNADTALAYLESLQREDGGYEAWGGVTEATGLALLVLEGKPAERAAAFLLTQMTEDGGFVGYPELDPQDDSCTAATVLNGLIAAGATVPPEAVTRLLSHQDQDGVFSWKLGTDPDPLFSTPQCALTVAHLIAGKTVFESLPFYIASPDSDIYADWDTIPVWARDGVVFARKRSLMVGDTTGNFMPDRIMKRSELAALLKSLGLSRGTKDAETYTDVLPGAWYADAVRYVGENNLMWGQDGLFQPDATLTREELAFWLAQALDLTVTYSESGPMDLSKARPEYADAVHAMFAEGLMVGDGTRFNPSSAVTRAQMATMLKKLHD